MYPISKEGNQLTNCLSMRNSVTTHTKADVEMKIPEWIVKLEKNIIQ